MKKKSQLIFNRQNFVIALVAAILGFVVFLVLFYANGVSLYNAVNSCFIVAMIELLLTGFYAVVNFGMFDVVAVGFANLFAVAKKNGTKKYDGIFDYQEARREIRKSNLYRCVPLLIVGVLYILVAIALRIAWQASL